MKHIDIYKYNFAKSETLNNIINPLKTDMKYIRHAYDLHMGIGMKFQSHGRRRKQYI